MTIILPIGNLANSRPVCMVQSGRVLEHSKQTFLEQYVALLKAFDIEFDESYIFKELIE